MKWLISLLLVCTLAFSLMGCSRDEWESVFYKILVSPAARLVLLDGSTTIVSSEIDSLSSFANMNLRITPLEPVDGENDWLYRIVFTRRKWC